MEYNERTVRRIVEGLRNAAPPERHDPFVYKERTIGYVPRSFEGRMELLRSRYTDTRRFDNLGYFTLGDIIAGMFIRDYERQLRKTGEQLPLF